MVEKNQIYKHFKGGLYLVLDVVYSATHNEPYVLYKEYRTRSEKWIRKLTEFEEMVDFGSSKIPRFKLLEK